jgi:hypothetical protein
MRFLLVRWSSAAVLCRWRFRQQYDTELEAALGYDQAIRKLAPHEAEGFCNFPATSMPPNMQGGGLLPVSGAPVDTPCRAAWNDDTHVCHRPLFKGRDCHTCVLTRHILSILDQMPFV